MIIRFNLADNYRFTIFYGNQYWEKLINDLWRNHKEEGPAYIGKSGNKYWYVNGKYIKEEYPK